jgi:serine protease
MPSDSERLHVGRRRFLRQTGLTIGGLSIFDTAVARVTAMLLPVDSTSDPQSAGQRYLDAAPVGIDARWAWTRRNGAGEGVGFVDIEQGWFLGFDAASDVNQHEDLPRRTDRLRVSAGVPRTIDSATCTQSRHHGSAVVGVVAGVDNALGIVGAAPNVMFVEVVSHINGSVKGDVANAIDKVLPFMAAGDVLLIEWQDVIGSTPNVPAEVKDSTFAAIGRAIMKGIVVIEPAGNFSVNLDTINTLNPAHAQFRDSSAIIVSACNQPDAMGNGRSRWVATAADFPDASTFPPFLPNCNPPGLPPVFPGANFGPRVDCYAWGAGIVASGYGWSGGTAGTNSYTNRFGGTSGAAAIVAGAAVVLQGLHKYVRGRPLTSVEMRAALKANGTPPQLTNPMERIGVMPDIRRVADALGLSTDSVPSAPSNLRIID